MPNGLKTTLLLATLTGLLVAFGGAIGGRGGLMVMLALSALMNLGAWFFSDRMVIRMTGAVPAAPGELGWLKEACAELAGRAGIPTPRLYVVPHEQSPNAFATGRSPDKGVVAVTAGLLRHLSQREVRAVVAHEIGHIANRDTLTSSIAATLAGAISSLAWGAMYGGGRRRNGGGGLMMILVALLAPLAATLIRLAISRTREYSADRHAAEISGDPAGLASALSALTGGVRAEPMQNPHAHSVHFIVNGFSGNLAGLMSTHPPLDERIRRLRAMAGEA